MVRCVVKIEKNSQTKLGKCPIPSFPVLEEHRGQWRQDDFDRVRASMRANRFGVHAALVAHAAAPVIVSVAVEDFLPETCLWHTQPIPFAWHLGEVTDHQNPLIGSVAATQKTED